jgi:hypothetical protein
MSFSGLVSLCDRSCIVINEMQYVKGFLSLVESLLIVVNGRCQALKSVTQKSAKVAWFKKKVREIKPLLYNGFSLSLSFEVYVA